jgi:hypothetical protein
MAIIFRWFPTNFPYVDEMLSEIGKKIFLSKSYSCKLFHYFTTTFLAYGRATG